MHLNGAAGAILWIMRRFTAAAVCAVAVLSFFGVTAEAASVVWTKTEVGGLCNGGESESRSWTGKTSTVSNCYAFDNSALINPTMSISYNVRVVKGETGEVVPPGSTVPKDTVLKYEFIPHVSNDIYWFATGRYYDSPYGDWVSGAGRPSGNLCIEKNRVTGYGDDQGSPMHASLSVDPPSKSVAISNASCADAGGSSKQCTLSTPGTVNATFTFQNTTGHFYIVGGEAYRGGYCSKDIDPAQIDRNPPSHGNADSWDPEGIYTLQVPVQTIAYPIHVSEETQQTGGAPTSPSVAAAGSTQCTTGVPYSLTLAATDPDGDTIRYGIDWDGNGTIDQFAPNSGYVASGVTQSASRTYSTEGSKTVRVLAQDIRGLNSSWVEHTFTCANAPEQEEEEQVQEEEEVVPDENPQATLSIRAIPPLVRSGETTHIHWSATNVVSCAMSATNGDGGGSWNVVASPEGGKETSAITEQTKYQLSCLDLDGNSLTGTATVEIVPVHHEE